MGISYVLSVKEILTITAILKSENIVGLSLDSDFQDGDIDQIVKDMEKKDLLFIVDNSKIFISPVLNFIFDCIINAPLVIKAYNILCYVNAGIAVILKKDSHSKNSYIFMPTEDSVTTANSIWELFEVGFEVIPFDMFTKESGQWVQRDLNIEQLIIYINRFYTKSQGDI